MGERLPDKYCIAAGLNPPCHSSAAGRYQITKGTWIRLKGRLLLTSFMPEAQDDAAVELLKEAGAFDLINAGSIKAAINLEHSEWASLPGSTSGQPQTPLVALLAAYTGAGGMVA
jgi:muramidase (phage lysozyme)